MTARADNTRVLIGTYPAERVICECPDPETGVLDALLIAEALNHSPTHRAEGGR